MEAVYGYSAYRSDDAFRRESSGTDADQAGHSVDDNGLGLSADVQESREWQSRRPHGEAGRAASGVFAFRRRQLSRRRPHQRALRVEEDDWAACRSAYTSEPMELSLFGWTWTAGVPGLVRRPAYAKRASDLWRLLDAAGACGAGQGP